MPESNMPLTPRDVHRARRRIAPFIRHTPLEASAALSAELGFAVSLKLDCQQVTGSFKARGGFNKLLSLVEEGHRGGVVAPTAGGHGIGISYAGRRLGIPTEVFVPRSADPCKLAAIAENGAVIRHFDDMPKARAAAREAAKERGLAFCSAYDDERMIEAGGTIALEILEDAPDVDLVVTGVGGGGLVAGMALVLKAANPAIRVIGVQPACSAPLAHWHAAGKPVDVPLTPSFAEGIGARVEPTAITWPYVQRLVDGFVLVGEDELRAAMAWAFVERREVVEGASAASIAGLRKLDLGGRAPEHAVAVVTGRNIDASRFLELVAAPMAALRARA